MASNNPASDMKITLRRDSIPGRRFPWRSNPGYVAIVDGETVARAGSTRSLDVAYYGLIRRLRTLYGREAIERARFEH